MAIIHVPSISPFAPTGPFHETDVSPVQSHRLAYEVAALSRKLETLLAQYEAEVGIVSLLQAEALDESKPPKNKMISKDLQVAEKRLLGSMLPFEIRSLRASIKALKSDLALQY